MNYVADPFKAYLDKHTKLNPIMSYKNNAQISRFQLSEDKVSIRIIFLETCRITY